VLSCGSGVRQGESLSPLLFSLYLYDLLTYLTDKQNTGVNLEFMENDIISYIHILVLLCADYTVIVSKSADEFQKCLNDFNQYCMEWKLKLNTNQTKVKLYSAPLNEKSVTLTSLLLEIILK